MPRTVHHTDAITWLESQAILTGCSFITSLPDVSEFPKLTLLEWKNWFVHTALLVMSKCPDDGVTVFFQTDIKRDGVWIDKGFLCQKAAELAGHSLLAHKIVCRAPAGALGYGRPVYSHLLCFSRGLRTDESVAFADVLPEAGDVTWARGMGTKACELACRMVLAYTKSHTIVDPFCGHGSVLATAESLGFNSIGVDRSLKCVNLARAAAFCS